MIKYVKSKLFYFFEGIWLPIHGNLVGMHHLIRGHKVRWFQDPDLWIAHLGWIYCHNCPDTEQDEHGHGDLAIWGFYFHRIHRLLQKLCEFLGHKEANESLTSIGDGKYVPSGQFYCSRCSMDLKSYESGEVI